MTILEQLLAWPLSSFGITHFLLAFTLLS